MRKGQGKSKQKTPVILGSSKLPAINKQAQFLKKQETITFLQKLEETGFVARACRESGIPWRTLYRAKQQHEAFAKLWDDALEIGSAWRRAVMDEGFHQRGFEGLLEPIYQSGRRVFDRVKVKGKYVDVPAFKRVYDTTAAIFVSKSEDPKYKDSADPNANRGQIDITLQWQASTPSGETIAGAVRVSA
jgi:hypothetical protein